MKNHLGEYKQKCYIKFYITSACRFIFIIVNITKASSYKESKKNGRLWCANHPSRESRPAFFQVFIQISMHSKSWLSINLKNNNQHEWKLLRYLSPNTKNG